MHLRFWHTGIIKNLKFEAHNQTWLRGARLDSHHISMAASSAEAAVGWEQQQQKLQEDLLAVTLHSNRQSTGTGCEEQHSNIRAHEAQWQQQNQQPPQQQQQQLDTTMQWLSTAVGDGAGLEAGGQRMVLDLDDFVTAGEHT